MPQASDELRAKMKRYFGDAIDDDGPTQFLESQGYKLTRSWTWIPPARVRTEQDMTEQEKDCVLFLIEEWDQGGVEFAT